MTRHCVYLTLKEGQAPPSDFANFRSVRRTGWPIVVWVDSEEERDLLTTAWAHLGFDVQAGEGFDGIDRTQRKNPNEY